MSISLPSLEINLKSLSKAQLLEQIVKWGEPKYRAAQIWSWLYQKGIIEIDQMTNLSQSFRQTLKTQTWISKAELRDQIQSEVDRSTKFLFRVAGGEDVETVLMPDGDRLTVCLSSQVGCAMDCAFCATGQMGFFRNLPVDGVMDQFLAIQTKLQENTDEYIRQTKFNNKRKITNVVFMGMGEPLANYQQVVSAIRILTDPDGINLAGRRITVSTVGLAPRIEQLAKEGLGCKLALSLNATTDEIRTRLMPINHRYPIREIMSAVRFWIETTGMSVTFEYVMIRGLNDSLVDAERLCRLVQNIPCKINLIPFNEIEGSDLRRPEERRIERFHRILTQHHRVAPVRYSKGRDIAAACGQLRTIYDQTGTRLSINPATS
ncbi:23S rRNA (adenine(2503)-C(2))-methyltransferase RlmN [Candidatus Poribacteria bacterium]|nr:23S rRNA (adenine(2503)-C(2))-methyltransferase RlmN [Candidatus Poribacteria bacterium]